MGNLTGGGVGAGAAAGAGIGGGGIGGAIVGGSGARRWWQRPIQDTTAEAALAFLVPSDVPPSLLQRATRRALRAAGRATPGRGKVRATGTLEHASALRLRVRVQLVVRGEGTDKRWALQAEAAFAEAFLATLARKGFEATRTDAPG